MSFRIFGMEVSPYSVKVRSYFRYKQIPHEWIIRGMATMEEFQKYAKLPLVPLLVTPENVGIQDSTPIMEKMEDQYPDKSVSIDDPALNFLSQLLEEYADEWGNKTMFHYRWAYDDNVESCARRIAEEQMGGNGEEEQIAGIATMLKERMTSRLYIVGSSDKTKGIIEGSFKRQLEILEAHFAGGRAYLFGGRPCMADFGVYAQLYQHYCDPVGQKIIDEQAAHTRDWFLRMLQPTVEGEFENWDSLSKTMLPLLREEVGALFLPWAKANSDAGLAGEESFDVQLSSGEFSQAPTKYSIKSYAELRRKYAELAGDENLNTILADANCIDYLN